jgi:hypothetical protein
LVFYFAVIGFPENTILNAEGGQKIGIITGKVDANE